MSGLSLGHTGGTIDKLESIPGFRTSLKIKEFIQNVKDIGISITGQTGNLAPADKKMYALRNATATTSNISLIASSIMSKKIASGADKIVLDIKTGSGAFMKNLEDSIELAKTMVAIGERVQKTTVCVISDMNIPLGNAIGNSLEVIEAINTLKGNGPKDLQDISFELSAKMLEIAGIGDIDLCRMKVHEIVSTKKALIKFAEMIERQGGDPDIIFNFDLFDKTSITYDFISEQNGFIESIKTDILGASSMSLGAGRETKEDKIDYAAGIILNKKTGMPVRKGEVIATLYTNDQNKLETSIKILKEAFTFSNVCPITKPLILAFIDSKGSTKFERAWKSD